MEKNVQYQRIMEAIHGNGDSFAQVLQEQQQYLYRIAFHYSCVDYIRRRRRAHCLAAAASCLVFLLSLGALSSAVASRLPLVGNLFSALHGQTDLQGMEEQAEDMGLTAVSNGIQVTLEQAYCDGELLFLAYRVESQEAWSREEAGASPAQLLYQGYARANGEQELVEWGTAGLEGRYLDAHTFLGAEYYLLQDMDLGETFDLKIGIGSWNPDPEGKWGTERVGYWTFETEICQETEGIQDYDVRIRGKQEGYAIEKISVSPVLISFYLSIPEEAEALDHLIHVYRGEEMVPMFLWETRGEQVEQAVLYYALAEAGEPSP